jgi:hypothetical protein
LKVKAADFIGGLRSWLSVTGGHQHPGCNFLSEFYCYEVIGEKSTLFLVTPDKYFGAILDVLKKRT